MEIIDLYEYVKLTNCELIKRIMELEKELKQLKEELKILEDENET